MPQPTLHPALAGLVPMPGWVAPGDGSFRLSDSSCIAAPAEPRVRLVTDHLVADIQSMCAFRLGATATPGAGDVHLDLQPERAELGDEGYELTITTDSVHLAARTAHGLWNGSRTLLQLCVHGAREVPVVRITDVPRFEWRGAMLDVARHFFSVDHITRFVELISRWKLNRLHLHLTDDQGWRIEIPGWPALTAVGGSSSCGGDAGGWFSVDDWREIVTHADRHFVTVVPEIDLPGHTHAALASVPELNPGGVAPPPYTGTEVGFSSLRLDLPATERFVTDVVAAIAAITPGPYLHLGGDEANATARDAYAEFVRRLQAEARRHGKVMIGWEEIATTSLHPSTLVQHWLRPEVAATALPPTRFVMSPARHAYLDMRHRPDDTVGRRWAGAIDLDTAYGWDPADLLDGVGDDRIAGVEGALWTEKVRAFSDVEQLCFPRLACIAEVGWTPRASRSWESFRGRVAGEVERLAAGGVNVYRSPLLRPAADTDG